MIMGLTIVVALIVWLKSVIPADVIDKINFSEVSPVLMMSVFFVSESILGLIPPDFFIMWLQQFDTFWMMLLLLSILSYAGGLVSFWMGTQLRHNEAVNNFIQTKFKNITPMVSKWGGTFVILAAVTPLPFSPVSLLGGTLKFSFKSYALCATSRFVRFAIYGYIFVNVM